MVIRDHRLFYITVVMVSDDDFFPFLIAFLQNYQTVPETPLASCHVLKEQHDNWVDVQVGVAGGHDNESDSTACCYICRMRYLRS